MKFNDREDVISGNKLYRNMRRSKCMGVCAGLADFYDTDRHLVRVLAIISAFFFTTATICIYLIAALIVPKRPNWSYL